MVRALRDIVRRAEPLPEAEQEAIAAIIKAEIEDEEAWQKRFANTGTTLEKLVGRAKKQYAAGEFGEPAGRPLN